MKFTTSWWMFLRVLICVVLVLSGYLLGKRDVIELRQILSNELVDRIDMATTSIKYEDVENLESKRRQGFRKMFLAASNAMIYKEHGYLTDEEFKNIRPLLEVVCEYANKHEEDYNYFFSESLYQGNRSEGLIESDSVFKENLIRLKNGDF